jgi:hypothetical protein
MWAAAHNASFSEGLHMTTDLPRIDAPADPRCKLVTVRVKRTRCPQCRSVNLRRYRSTNDQGDGSALAYVKCLVCAARFKLLQE